MTKREILTFICKWARSIVLGTLIVAGLVTLAVYLIPPTYKATAKVLIERNLAPIRTDRVVPSLEMLEVMNTETEIILSRPVMQAVVDELRPYDRPVRDSALRRAVTAATDRLVDWGLISAVTPQEKWVARLLRTVEVEPATNSNVLEIDYWEEDPGHAAAIVNAIVDSYQAKRLAIYAARGATEFYRQEIDRERQEVDRLRVELIQFKQARSLAAIERTQQELVQQIGTSLDRRSQLRQELGDLSSRFDESAVPVVMAQRKLAGVDKEIDDMKGQLQTIEADLLKVREMEREITNREEALESLRKLYEEQRLREAADVATTNLRVIAYADVPERPPFPRLFFIAIGIAGGGLLSLGLALIREYFDLRVNDPDMVEEILGVPVVASVGHYRV